MQVIEKPLCRCAILVGEVDTAQELLQLPPAFNSFADMRLAAYQFSRLHFMADSTSSAPRKAGIGAKEFLDYLLEFRVLGLRRLVAVSVLSFCGSSILIRHIRLVSRDASRSPRRRDAVESMPYGMPLCAAHRA
jgi:hypothetical protein